MFLSGGQGGVEGSPARLDNLEWFWWALAENPRYWAGGSPKQLRDGSMVGAEDSQGDLSGEFSWDVCRRGSFLGPWDGFR